MGVRCAVLLTLLPAVAQAGDLPARLTVEAEPGAELCPDQPALAARVEAILRRPLAAGLPTSTLAIDVRFERAADSSFVATLTTRGAKPGQRLLRDTDPTCGALGQAVSVAIALLLDNALNEGESQSASQPTLPPPLPSANPGPADAAAVTQEQPSHKWKARALLQAGGSYGLGGDGALVGFGRLGVRYGGWLTDVGAGGNVPTQQGFAGGSVETSLLFASLRACYLGGSAFALGPCLHLGAGRLMGAGEGYRSAQRSSLPWTAAGGGLAAEMLLGARLFASLEASLWMSTRRQTFSVEEAGIAWESRPLAGALTAGLGVSLF
jgi:hypothetical protein